MPECICHFAVNSIQRSTGRSVTAAVAYRTCSKIVDDRTGEVFDYSRKKGLEYTENVFPKDIANQKCTISELWNTIEKSEKRKNSIVGREYVIALPEELDKDNRKKLAIEFTKYISNKYKIIANVAIHVPGKDNDVRNYHAHIMTSTREITSNGFGEKTRILDCKSTSQKEIIDLRNVWAEMGNRYLEATQSNRRMDARSFADRGLDAIPEVHLGPAVSAMERRGIVTDKGTLNRKIRIRNQEIKQIDLELKNIEEAIQAAEVERLRRSEAEKERQRLEAEEKEQWKSDLATEAREKAIEVEAAKIDAKQQQLRKQFDAAQVKWSTIREAEPGYGVFVESRNHRSWAVEFEQQENDRRRAWEALGGDMAAPDKGEAEVNRRLTPEFARSEAEKIVEAAERRELAEREKREAQKRTEAAEMEAQIRQKEREKGYALPLKVDPDKRVALILAVGENTREVIGKIISLKQKGVVLKIGAISCTFARDKILDICPAPEQSRSDQAQTQAISRRLEKRDLDLGR